MTNVAAPIVQSISRATSAMADATGGATFTFEAIPTGQQWTGSLQCPSAPYTAQFISVNNGDLLGAFNASNNFGPVYVGPGGRIVVTAYGLVAGITYTMTFTGYVTTGGPVEPIFPNAYADTVIATNQGGLQYVSYTLPAPGGVGTVLGDPAPGFAIRVHSATLRTLSSVSDVGLLSLGPRLGGNAIPFYAVVLPGSGFFAQTILLNGLLLDGLIIVQTSASSLDVDLFYDIVQI